MISSPTLLRLQANAVQTGGCASFAELAALSLARQLVRKGRRLDARRLLRAYLAHHGPTPRINAAWALTASA